MVWNDRSRNLVRTPEAHRQIKLAASPSRGDRPVPRVSLQELEPAIRVFVSPLLRRFRSSSETLHHSRRRRAKGRRAFRMVAHVLLKRFVTQQEAESLARVFINRRLQVECLERNHMLRRLCGIALNYLEVKMVIDDPVVGHVENRSVFQEELWQVLSALAINIHGTLVCWHNVVYGTWR